MDVTHPLQERRLIIHATCATCSCTSGVATISRLLEIIGLFCKSALQKRRYSAKETCNFKEPTNRSHPIFGCEDGRVDISDTGPTNKICRRATSEKRPRTRACHE